MGLVVEVEMLMVHGSVATEGVKCELYIRSAREEDCCKCQLDSMECQYLILVQQIQMRVISRDSHVCKKSLEARFL